MPANVITRLIKSTAARFAATIAPTRTDRYCSICESVADQFLPHGDPPRANARCPHCRSLERHRLDWLFFQQRTNLFSGDTIRFLHIAPEPFLSDRFGRLPNVDYLSADLMNPRAMVKMDLTDIEYADHSFDAIYCSHVLEHIPDDRKALAELYRVLSPGGWALLQVPITTKQTFEDPSITTPEDRKRVFGQWDHVRRCGPDYVERMREAGFEAETLMSTDIIPADECARMGIQTERRLFFCRKA